MALYILLITSFLTDKSLSGITFTGNYIGTHDHNMMSICMLKIYGDSIILRTYLLGLLRAWGFSSKLKKEPAFFLFIKNRQSINKEL